MPEQNDKSYYAARAARCRELAETSSDPAIAAIHRKMAASYSELVELMPTERPALRVVGRS